MSKFLPGEQANQFLHIPSQFAPAIEKSGLNNHGTPSPRVTDSNRNFGNLVRD
jgi:hypothetical protein